MRRILFLLLAAGALCALPAPAGAAGAPAGVRLLACVPALAPEERSATFEASVRATAWSERMELRFVLQQRLPGELTWKRVAAPGFGEWLRSHPAVERYAYVRTVTNLTAPASYRVRVRFRWRDAEGAVRKRARVTSPVCRQPDMRPDLEPLRITVEAPGRYVVAIRNRGRTTAASATATLRVGDAEPLLLPLPAIASGGVRALVFSGPHCEPGTELEAVVDAGAAVDERDESDNALVVPCPAG